jgi:O-antigen/teichoic acid export membrane protein
MARGRRGRPATELRRAAASVVFKLLSSPFEKACRLLIVLVTAPALGAAAFGTYQFAGAVGSLLSIGTELGLGTWTTRAIAREVQRAGPITALGLRLRLTSAVPYLLLLGSVGLSQPPGDARRAVLVLGMATLAGSFVDYFGAVLRGHEAFGREAAANAARAVLTTAGALGGLSLQHSLMGLAIGAALGALASAAVGWWLLRSRAPSAQGRGEGPLLEGAAVRAALREAMPLWLAGLLSTLYFRCDVVLVRALSGDAEVGLYSAAYRVFEALLILPSAVMAVALPRLARAQDSPRWTLLEARLAAGLTALGVLVSLPVYFARAAIVTLAFGPDFARAAASLRILALTVPACFLNFAVCQFLIARGRERAYLVLVSGMLVLNVSVNLVVVPRLGGPGAAWATLVTEAALALGCAVVLGAARERRPVV